MKKKKILGIVILNIVIAIVIVLIVIMIFADKKELRKIWENLKPHKPGNEVYGDILNPSCYLYFLNESLDFFTQFCNSSAARNDSYSFCCREMDVWFCEEGENFTGREDYTTITCNYPVILNSIENPLNCEKVNCSQFED